ncbi:hypothetical protein DN730_11300 [Marinomonas piezotolerans]|uniref:Flagellar protein FliT n=1 Tax=Marinomonas piezotolerans TaxID=2213058 RepID=A0A370U8T8_9GAMM|nr:hypothetical protein [Marinomonas piezotolerans]RDL44206.1 hypothetical protein DN730_11300 [Marinomonas piezotolerans]
MSESSLLVELILLETQLKDLSSAQNFEELLSILNSKHDFIHGLDVSDMNDDEKKAFISFSQTHYDVMLSIQAIREETLQDLKKRNFGKKKIKQYKGVRNSAR